MVAVLDLPRIVVVAVLDVPRILVVVVLDVPWILVVATSTQLSYTINSF